MSTSHSSGDRYLRPILASLAAGGIAVLMLSLFLLAAGKAPLDTLGAIAVGAFGTRLGLTETLTRMTPILLCALGASIPAKAGLFNIGGEGQLHCGAIGATGVALYAGWLPHGAVIPAMIVAALAAGGLCGFVPGVLRAKWNVNEVLVSLMLNYIAIYLVQYLVHGDWRDPNALGWPYTSVFPAWAVLPVLEDSNVHLGLLLGLLLALSSYLVMRKTTWGYAMRVIEANPLAARLNGIKVTRYLLVLMMVGGAVAALAGLGEVSVIQRRLRSNISPGYGYTGFLIAWLARNDFLWVVPVAFLVGGLFSGADALQLSAGLPSATVDIFMALVFLAFLAQEYHFSLSFGRKAGNL